MALQIEDAKKALVLYGNKVSQIIKDALTDLHKIKGVSTKLHGPETLNLERLPMRSSPDLSPTACPHTD